ncbi:hypothetical protein K502DRAFT_325467 [Neoconidiobolus thromboides FSU 785]|nr:hypothetical protein K502DRAFT_325467 [Neoconidiobolus thromboides FSU 785]
MDYNTYIPNTTMDSYHAPQRSTINSYETITISNSPSSWVEDGFIESSTTLNHNIAPVQDDFNHYYEMDAYHNHPATSSFEMNSYQAYDNTNNNLYYNSHPASMVPMYYNNNAQVSYPLEMSYVPVMTSTSTSNNENIMSSTMTSYPMNSTISSENNTYYNNNMPLIFNHDLRGRAENWNHEETNTFIQILLQNSHQFQNIRRYPGLWTVIKQSMESKGYKRSIEKCKNRWKVLVAKYKKCHLEMVKSTHRKNSTPSFEFFYPIQQLLYPNYSFSQEGIQRKFKTTPKPKIQSQRENKSMATYLFPYATSKP